jgi:hypothetical protein
MSIVDGLILALSVSEFGAAGTLAKSTVFGLEIKPSPI